MPNIAVFCALPPDRNTGMATVDLSAVSVLRRLAPNAQITLYAFGKVPAHSYQCGDLPYSYLDVQDHEEAYFASDIFIFWGDFTHTRNYWRVDRGLVEAQVGGLAQVEQETWYAQQFLRYSRYVFFNGAPDGLVKRSIVAGSTLITQEASDHLDVPYMQAYKAFFSQVHSVFLRDALSAAKISPLRGNEATLGCDCALLLEQQDLLAIKHFTPATQRSGVGVFFGRSPRKARMMLFSVLVARALGEKRRWIPWLGWGGARKDRWPYMVFGYKIRAADADTGAILSQLSGHKFIITDTYHLCVNAWRMGIPALCIGEGGRMAMHSLGDKKKEILYEMYGARRFYVYLEMLMRFRDMRSLAKQAAISLSDDALTGVVKDTIAAHRQMTISHLARAIAQLNNA